VYQLSRAIYRELAPLVDESRPSWQQCSNREMVLHSCEKTVERLAKDRRHFAKPARSLFNEIRVYFSLASQLRVYMIVQRNIDLAHELLARMPELELSSDGLPRSCQAMTRKGRPCQRPPLPRSEYCPSHQHLTETFEELDELEGIELAA
jgi:hypothetical protein